MSMPALSQHSLSVPRSGIRDVFDRVEHVPDAISLCVGEPSATAAPHIVEAACRSIREGHTTYTNVLGIEPFREAVAAYSEKVKGLRYDVDTEIQAVDGATIGLFLAMKALLDAGRRSDPSVAVLHLVRCGGPVVRRSAGCPSRSNRNTRCG